MTDAVASSSLPASRSRAATNPWVVAAVVVVPLLAGLSLVGALARGIFNNPAVANGNVALLAVAALLCIAPTLVNLAVTLPNGTATVNLPIRLHRD